MAAAATEHSFQKAITGVSAEGEGTLKEGEVTISAVATSSGAFLVGEEISAVGLPAGTTIVKVEPAVLEVSQAVEAGKSGSGVALKAGESFVHPWGVSVGAEGDLFVADPGEAGVGPSSLDVFGAAGGTVARVGALAGGYTRGVAVSDATGDLYVATPPPVPNEVQAFAPVIKGVPVLGYLELPPWTGAKTERGSFGSNYAYVAVDNSSDAHAGDVEVLDTEIVAGANGVVDVIAPTESGGEGETVQELPTPNPEGEIGDVPAVSPVTGDVYVPDAKAGTVEVFNVAGERVFEPEPQGADTPAKAFTPIAVSVDPSTGEVYVVDGAHHVVDEFSGKGQYVGQITEAKAGEALKEPLGVAISSSGVVYVSEGAGRAVEVYGAEPPSAPVVESESVAKVTDDSATLTAEIVPGSEGVSYRFEYGVCAGLGACVAGAFEHVVPVPDGVLVAGFVADTVSAPVAGLAAGRAYHFRVVAENGLGVAHVLAGETMFSMRAAGAFGLPDGREWEMVSPPNKDGALIEPIDGAPDVAGGEIQAAASGDAISYLADAPTESGAQGYSNFVQVLSTRGPGGWSSRDLAPPHITETGLSVGWGEEYRFFSEDLSRAIAQPFGAFDPALSPEASEQTAFLRTDYLNANPEEPCSGSCYQPLVTGATGYANVPAGTHFGEEGLCPSPSVQCGPLFLGATGDLSHVVVKSPVTLTAGGGEGLYEWNAGEAPAGQLKPVSLLPNELPASGSELGFSTFGYDSRDTISGDGSRVFWSAEGHLYMRDTTRGKTIQLDVPEGEPGCPAVDRCGEGAVDAEFQLASSSGDVVFFTDTQKLTANAAEYGSTRVGTQQGAADLYECVIREDVCGLSDVAPSGGVVGSVLGASTDGSWVYFVANGVLAPGAVTGSCPNFSISHEGFPHARCDLYVRHGGVTSLVGVLSGDDNPDWVAELNQMTARVSPDGRWLAFMSLRSLTGYGNADAVSGRPDEEVFLYHAPESLAGGAGGLVCASCDPTGARPHGVEYSPSVFSSIPLAGGQKIWGAHTWLAGNVPTWMPYRLHGAVYQPRYLSDNGRLFFNSSDGLVPRDGNGTEDVYEFEPEGVPAGAHACSSGSGGGGEVFVPARSVTVEEGSPTEHTVQEPAGCVALISSGESVRESAFLDASDGGGDVFFLTSAKLAPQDFDDALDVYDAQECTGAVPCPPPVAVAPAACSTEASCKAAPSPQPGIFGLSGSATFSGPGNPAPPPPGIGKPKSAAEVRAEKLARALKQCKKDRSKKKRLACVRLAHKRYGALGAKKAKHASSAVRGVK